MIVAMSDFGQDLQPKVRASHSLFHEMSFLHILRALNELDPSHTIPFPPSSWKVDIPNPISWYQLDIQEVERRLSAHSFYNNILRSITNDPGIMRTLLVPFAAIAFVVAYPPYWLSTLGRVQEYAVIYGRLSDDILANLVDPWVDGIRTRLEEALRELYGEARKEVVALVEEAVEAEKAKVAQENESEPVSQGEVAESFWLYLNATAALAGLAVLRTRQTGP